MDKTIPRPQCPVCEWPPNDHTAVTGIRCEWRNGADAADLPRAQREWDLVAAHLAAGGDEEAMEQLVDLARGETAGLEEILAAGEKALAAQGLEPQHESLSAIAMLLASLPERELGCRELGCLAFLCVGRRAMEIYLADADSYGTIRIHRSHRRWTWSALAPGLPEAEPERRFLLASGVGRSSETPPAQLARLIGSAMPAVEELRLPRRCALVLLSTCPGWQVLERVARLAQRRYGAAAMVYSGVPEEREAVEDLVKQAPLSTTYELVVLEPDGDGRMHLQPIVLFGPGASRNGGVDVNVYAPAGIDGPVTLPFVRREQRLERPPASWSPIRMVEADLARGESHTVHFDLDGSGMVQASNVDGAVDQRRPWAELLARIPRQLERRPADVVFAVELVEGQDAQARLDLVRATVAAIAHETRVSGQVRVGLIGYAQHLLAGAEDPLAAVVLDTPQRAYSALRRWSPQPNRNDFAAAVEHALQVAARLPWREDAHRVLVTVGSRPPYPLRKGPDRAPVCRFGVDWRRYVDKLIALKVRRIAVWSDPLWQIDRIDTPAWLRCNQAWAALGADHLATTAEAAVDRVLRATGMPLAAPETPFAYLETLNN